MARVDLLLGKPPREGTLPAAVAELLRGRGHQVRVHLPRQEPVGTGTLAGSDLVLHRGLSDVADDLLDALGAAGVPVCNPWPASRALRDRTRWTALLRAAGVPVPAQVVRMSWAEVLAGAGTEVVVKAAAGTGRGRGVLTGTRDTLPGEAPGPGPWVVEHRLPHDGTDRKLYVVGPAVRGLLKASTLTSGHTPGGVPFEPDAELRQLARRAARAVDGHLLGVDVVLGPDGPVVVDVNDVPGYRGVTDAATLVAAHLLSPHLAAR